MCLVRTNELSGYALGSLGREAEDADQKAKKSITDSSTALTDSATALSQAQDALDKAGKAAKSLGEAENRADKAQAASSNALALATGARREADSFERDIASAKKQVDDEKKQVAELSSDVLAARNDLVVLQSLTSARHVIADRLPALIGQLKPLQGKKVVLLSWAGDEEARSFCRSITDALSAAGLDTKLAVCGAAGGGSPNPGVVIVGPDFKDAELLTQALNTATQSIPTPWPNVVTAPTDPNNVPLALRIIVGPRMPFWFGK